MTRYLVAVGMVLALAGPGWAEECWKGENMNADINPERDARIAACEKRNFQRAVREAVAGESNPCNGTTTTQGRSAMEQAKLYREHHECMMRLSEQLRSAIIVGDPVPLHIECGEGCTQVRTDELGRLYVPSACEQRMEAAMRDIEPFILSVHKTLIVAPNGDWVWEFPEQPAYGIPKDEAQKLNAIKTEWESVKQACWRQP